MGRESRIEWTDHTWSPWWGCSIEPLTEPLDLSLSDLRGIDWAIVGGETGHHSERMQGRWVRSIFDATRKAKTKFFFKQWGDAHCSKTSDFFLTWNG